MATIERFEQIEAWQTARALTKLIYQISNKGEFARDFGLRDQIRWAAVSVMSNIAEGFESRTPGLFIDYLGRAKASAGEVRAQAYICLDVGYIDQTSFNSLFQIAEKCSKQLSNFIWYLESNRNNPRTLRESLQPYQLDQLDKPYQPDQP
jgi:four helix bundle protein